MRKKATASHFCMALYNKDMATEVCFIFLKKGTSQISCFGKIRKFSFYFGSLLHLKEVIEAYFSYFNIDDFNTFVVTTL